MLAELHKPDGNLTIEHLLAMAKWLQLQRMKQANEIKEAQAKRKVELQLNQQCQVLSESDLVKNDEPL